MPSPIALGCNRYEAYMQQSLPNTGFEFITGDYDFVYRNRQNQAKTSGKRKIISVFSGVFGSVWRSLKR